MLCLILYNKLIKYIFMETKVWCLSPYFRLKAVSLFCSEDLYTKEAFNEGGIEN